MQLTKTLFNLLIFGFTNVVSYNFNSDFVMCMTDYSFSQVNNSNLQVKNVCGLFGDNLKITCNNYINTHTPVLSYSECSSLLNYKLRTKVHENFPKFADFIVEFGHVKQYNSIENLIDRFYIFHDNMDFINVENVKGHSYVLGTTLFADMTNEEYKEFLTRQSNRPKNYCKTKTLSGSISSGIDWRTKNAVTSIKDQGQCGSCWSFSTTGAVEGAYAIKTGNLRSFSEQQLVDCASSYGNHGCDGGMMDYAFSYIMDNGITTEDKYPYLSGTTKKAGTCQSFTSSTKLSGCFNVPADELQLTLALDIQPVSIAIEADAKSFQLYTSGVYNDLTCGTTLDHGVTAVGFGTDVNGQDYYIVKNSWSTNWGDNGYIYIARNSISTSTKGICGIAMESSYPVI